jgi:hypothetical protein
VPFFIRLRALKEERGFPRLDELTDLIAEGDAGRPPDNWVQRQFDAGRALVLVDGVDELPQARRELMLKELRRLVHMFPRARYLITSRPLRVKEQPWQEWQEWLERAEFRRVRLLDMRLPTIDMFVDHWHAALLQTCRPNERADVRQLPALLKMLFRQRPALQKLATNPLICAMICALHYDRRKNLPSKRVALYSACIETLIMRDRGRAINLRGDFISLDPEQQQRLIQEFAYTLSQKDPDPQRDGEQQYDLFMSREDADQRFDYELGHMEVPAGTSGHGVCELFIQRVRLLQEPLAGRVEFVHRTFQEFLTARVAVQSGDIDGLLRHADDDRWRETSILAAGLTNARQSDRLLRGLLEQPAAPKAPAGLREPSGRERPAPEPHSDAAQWRTRRLTLAVACLETCVQRSPEIAAEVLQQVAPLFPPGNEDEARLLAAAGPAAIALLLPAAGHTEQAAAACVSALAQIGGEGALEALHSYVADQRYAVVRSLCDAWDRFDRHSYAQAILAKMPRLIFRQVNTWDAWELLTGVRELYIERLQLADLTPLGALIGLTTLALNDTPVQDLAPLAALSGLTKLYLNYTSVQDLAPLAALSGLTTLDLRGTPVQDLTPLAALSGLTKLYLSFTKMQDLTPVQGLRHLTIRK